MVSKENPGAKLQMKHLYTDVQGLVHSVGAEILSVCVSVHQRLKAPAGLSRKQEDTRCGAHRDCVHEHTPEKEAVFRL